MTANISQLYYVMGQSCYSPSVDMMVPCHNFCSSRPILQNFKFKDLWQRINVGIDLRYCSPTRFPKKRPKGWVQKQKSPDFDEVFSSPGPKVQVNYCHHLASVVCRLSSVKFSHFKLLLRNHLADWNRT